MCLSQKPFSAGLRAGFENEVTTKFRLSDCPTKSISATDQCNVQQNGWFMVPLVNEVTQALVIPIEAMGTSQHIPANQNIFTREEQQHVSLLATINQL